jgi:glyoxylase-like metal-dependent hydrolase (beta-lactamase superfamily II)
MKVHVEPRPLHEPLAGGTPGATVTVEPMIAGHVLWPRAMMESPGGRMMTAKLARALLTGAGAVRVPCPAFLLRHPSAGAVLVDTGLHPSIASDPSENFGGLGARLGKPELEPGSDAASQLRARGIEPGEVPVVVMTHMHMDHTSAISEFPQSTFVLSVAEWRAATEGARPAMNGYRHAHYDYAFDYRTVDFERGNAVGSYSSFARTFDLFGDGSVRLAYTPGHSAGHLSVVARLEERDFVVGGDAVYMEAQLRGSAPQAPRPFDAHNQRRSLQELKLFAHEFPEAIVTPGHDPEFYSRLEKRYE